MTHPTPSTGERGPYTVRWMDGHKIFAVEDHDERTIASYIFEADATGLADKLNSAYHASAARFAGLVAAATELCEDMEAMKDELTHDQTSVWRRQIAHELDRLRTAPGGGEGK